MVEIMPRCDVCGQDFPEEELLLSTLDQIKKLAELRGAGVITEREFQAKKKKLFQKI
jgi:hypothetical protein